jgi:hypothetical protein
MNTILIIFGIVGGIVSFVCVAFVCALVINYVFRLGE